jgi:hypothetical protein
MGFVGHFRMMKHSHVSIQTCDYCCRIVCQANRLVRIKKALNFLFCITIQKCFSLQGQVVAEVHF